VIRADGISIQSLLDGILPLFELDSYAPPLVMMQVVPGDLLDPAVEKDYMDTVRKHATAVPSPERIDRHAFYARARVHSRS
jgi:L-fucose mutarotase